MFKTWIEDIKKEKFEYDKLPYFQRKILSYFNNFASITYVFSFVLGILLGYLGGSYHG